MGVCVAETSRSAKICRSFYSFPSLIEQASLFIVLYKMVVSSRKRGWNVIYVWSFGFSHICVENSGISMPDVPPVVPVVLWQIISTVLPNPTRYLPRQTATNLGLISGISLASGIWEFWASCCGFGTASICGIKYSDTCFSENQTDLLYGAGNYSCL